MRITRSSSTRLIASPLNS
ncbi:hypothetical protein D043_1872A, partial [Vibrio parahaemolyticus EKP-021]